MRTGLFSTYRQVRIFGLAFFLVTTAVVGTISWFLNEGHLVYFLDDAYIHLATARQLAETGVWGVANAQFVFCSSSPHYTVLLTQLFRLAPWTYWPVLINVIAGMGLLWMACRWMENAGVAPQRAWIWLTVWMLLLPLPFLVLTGMEHTLQVWIDLGFALLVVQVLTGNVHPKLVQLGFMAALVTGIRYEGMFLVAAAGVLFFWKKKWPAAIASALGGGASVAGYGGFSLLQGGTFFPTSLLIKGYRPNGTLDSLIGMVKNLLTSLHEESFSAVLLVLLALAVAIPWIRSREPHLDQGWCLVALVLLTAPLHLLASKVGGARYEAYLIGLGLLGLVLTSESLEVVPVWKDRHWEGRFVQLFAVGVLLLPFFMRAGFFTWNLPRGTNNIYSQQVQMARFVHQYYPEASVAANDIGALTYENRLELTDMVGLGDQETLDLILERRNTPQSLLALTLRRKVEVAVVYDSWVAGWTPEPWIPVATWAIPDNFICGDSIVTWYGTDSAQATTLARYLHQFEQELPEKVHVRYLP